MENCLFTCFLWVSLLVVTFCVIVIFCLSFFSWGAKIGALHEMPAGGAEPGCAAAGTAHGVWRQLTRSTSRSPYEERWLGGARCFNQKAPEGPVTPPVIHRKEMTLLCVFLITGWLHNFVWHHWFVVKWASRETTLFNAVRQKFDWIDSCFYFLFFLLELNHTWFQFFSEL